MGYKIILVENQDENLTKRLRFHEIQELWNALIPKCDGLVAKPREPSQQSRALYRTWNAKVKRQAETV